MPDGALSHFMLETETKNQQKKGSTCNKIKQFWLKIVEHKRKFREIKRKEEQVVKKNLWRWKKYD